ncbi:hypothetical protein ATI61_103184 [Archangium gephyra]|uniref:Uncharacterized protein n=1 Tax=Archangium gephyra TaxID=48 RepID=A0AAC8Q6K5_9BACT|nr:hypothetical protein [Archangium gephyra]AKJ01476.1 Hypothetical protein AA314_03102 [Archangium gephyra]REG34291.1 hypothetical protein ATI61_103184 [Archangium gephyra]
MMPGQTSSLRLPSFLHGTFRSVQQKARREGLRCGEQYHKDGTFPAPQQLLEVPPGEVVLAQEVVDFQRERPAWRLYMVSNLMGHLSNTPSGEGQNPFPMRSAYETLFRETAWGALFFATTYLHPMSAERMAQRLQAVLRFWEPLQCACYLYKRLGEAYTLEELMVAACGWALDAWCPEKEASVHVRLEKATERMARATREDSIAAILRQLPRALSSEPDLKHRQVLADPIFQRERLATLDPPSFERVSGACTAELLALLFDWDDKLGMH